MSSGSQPPIVWTYLIAGAIWSLVGLADAIYLTIQDLVGSASSLHYRYRLREVLGGKYAHIGSLPLAALGAFAYFTVFSLSILAAFGYQIARPLLAALVGVMFLMTLWLLYLQAFVIHHFCQYCLLSAAVTTALGAILLGPRILKRRSGSH
jgi:uncharacterized membrane protein